jgi:hypothetical protein
LFRLITVLLDSFLFALWFPYGIRIGNHNRTNTHVQYIDLMSKRMPLGLQLLFSLTSGSEFRLEVRSLPREVSGREFGLGNETKVEKDPYRMSEAVSRPVSKRFIASVDFLIIKGELDTPPSLSLGFKNHICHGDDTIRTGKL